MDKYDRQIRLWASSGQRRLQDSHVCLLNCNSVGAEVLKNLVLPGIGEFTVVAGGTVQEGDLDANFFLNSGSIGIGRAEALCSSLQELNPDVKGHFYGRSVESVVQSPTDTGSFFAPFSAVVLSGHVHQNVLQELKKVLWDLQIPLFVVLTVGFYGVVRVYSKETTIIETHDPSKGYDLRIDQPWRELREYADSFELESMDATDHAHVPYIVIFIKALDRWRHDHSPMPSNYTEKKLFQSEYIHGMARDLGKEPNFLEASQGIHRALKVTQVPGSVQRLFDQVESQEIGSHTPVFWLLVHALRVFVQANGSLPLPGSLPDMTSTTADYVKLQAIYREKAQKDQHQFMEILRQQSEAAGRTMADISDGLVSVFCKNSEFLHVSSGSMEDYSASMAEQLSKGVAADYADELVVFFAILAYHNWLDQGRTGEYAGYVQAFATIVGGTDSIGPSVQKTLQQVYRQSTESYHNSCSLIGGVGAQEMLKVLTRQYIPLDDLFVYDGIKSSSAKWKV